MFALETIVMMNQLAAMQLGITPRRVGECKELICVDVIVRKVLEDVEL